MKNAAKVQAYFKVAVLISESDQLRVSIFSILNTEEKII